jgi:hypothetical protein
MNHEKTSFSGERFAGAIISVVQYLAPLRYGELHTERPLGVIEMTPRNNLFKCFMRATWCSTRPDSLTSGIPGDVRIGDANAHHADESTYQRSRASTRAALRCIPTALHPHSAQLPKCLEAINAMKQLADEVNRPHTFTQ